VIRSAIRGRLGLELQAELHRRIEKALDRRERHDELFQHVVEGQFHRKLAVADLQVPELMLQDNCDLFRVFLAQPVRNLGSGMARIDGDEQMMLARKPGARHLRKRRAHHPAQGNLSQQIVAHQVFGHDLLVPTGLPGGYSIHHVGAAKGLVAAVVELSPGRWGLLLPGAPGPRLNRLRHRTSISVTALH
jgi:hypothetical protein